MSSISSINSNSSVINVGRTTPVSPGSQTADKSIPVVMASDQSAIPVEEQNKVQSEVALSLLGIPRAEVALGIFADVNTYDVNPSEWSMKPAYHVNGDGVKHLPTEAGALVEASRNKTAVLTSKRFFRYQPGRVSAATFGIKSSVSVADFAENPVIRKYGIYDKYDGYYWETRNNGKEDNFGVVRRTQSLQYSPVSPYGLAGITPRRGEDNLGDENAPTIDNNQLDDYRIVGLGAAEGSEVLGDFISDRKILTELRYEFIDAVLARAFADIGNGGNLTATSVTIHKGTTTDAAAAQISLNTTSGFYNDLAFAYNESIGKLGYLTGEQMEAKCKRDLDYWIGNFLLDLKWGGTAHTKWNTTNFGITTGTSNGTWQVGQSVGVFPNISLFEGPIHAAMYDELNSGTGVLAAAGLSDAAETKLKSLVQSVIQVAFPVNGTNPTAFVPQIPTSSDYGTRGALDTFYDVKRNFWSYYVTTKKAPIPLSQVQPNKTYTVLTGGGSGQNTYGGTDSAITDFQAASAEFNAQTLADNVYPGRVFSTVGTLPGTPTAGDDEAQVLELITYTMAAKGSSSNSTSTSVTSNALRLFDSLTQAEVEQVIKDKCQRDVGYIIDGYKNDLIGGGDAETTYNMHMFCRGTGMSVYSQRNSDGSLTEPDRHGVLKGIIQKDLTSFGADTAQIAKQNDLAQRVVNNFTNEDIKTMSVGNRPFPGNLITLRDGLVHVHAGVYDPSLLKDAKPTKTIATNTANQDAGYVNRVATQFKLTEGNVTFGQHVKISWSGGDDEIQIQAASPELVKIHKGEVLRVRRVLGPKGNEFTLVKADGTNFNETAKSHIPLTVALTASNITAMGTIFIDTTAPFIFPRDYDLDLISSVDETYTSEIMTTADSTTNYANDGSSAGSGPASQRVYKHYAADAQLNTGSAPIGGMFPYMYAFEDNLLDINLEEKHLGFINTAINTTNSTNVDIIRSQIDNVNFYPEYVNWIKNNVKPEYWGVYEYRVPRSRFSHDPLDGKLSSAEALAYGGERRGSRYRVYSDLATGPQGTARPGEIYANSEGTQSKQNSLYEYDFTKVTMLKIEFSWYGAVGALFLAYVPVDNGEARWVRVHHLRASNQLKIASLGNATLPITYTTYGGGSLYCLGDGEDTLNQQGYGNLSHHIVKYGASYYIDGGDRGTVRLYSHNNQDTVSARGKRFAVTGNGSYANNTSIDGESASTPCLNVTETHTIGALKVESSFAVNGSNGVLNGLTTGSEPQEGDFIVVTGNQNDGGQFPDGTYKVASSGSGTITLQTAGGAAISGGSNDTSPTGTYTHTRLIDPIFYMGAKVKTDSLLDQNVKVVWAKTTSNTNKVFLSSELQSQSNISLLPDRAATVYGIETKKSIKSTREGNVVRNRVQVYPTKMSSANIGDDTVRLRFKKTPTFQTAVAPTGTYQLQGDYAITNTNEPLVATSGSANFLLNNQSTFGWFRGRIVSEAVTVFGRLYREVDSYYFELLESFEGEITLINGGFFMPDYKFQADGAIVDYVPAISTKFSEEKEGLSSVEIASNSVVPIAGTGINVATTYLRVGTEQFDLSPYFDYNKEYLSFPLTDIADSLYFAVDSDTASTNTDEISLGVTWEEQ